MARRMSRRKLLEGTAIIAASAAAGAVVSACGKATPQVVKETVIVEKPVEKVVKETVVVKQEVQKEVTKIVEKVVEPTKPKGITNALGVEFPPDALPLEQQYVLLPVGQVGGGYGHIMESLYNRAFEHAGGSIPLTTLDHDMNVIPIGCESWKQSEDGLSWDFKLRKELVFSDGKPVTAHDWVYTLQRSLANGYDFGWFYSDILNAEEVLAKKAKPEELGIQALDDYTLRIRTKEITPYLPAIGVWFEVAPKHAYEQYGENWALDPKKYISSGPFILAEFQRGIKHKWVLNKNYKGPPEAILCGDPRGDVAQRPAGLYRGTAPKLLHQCHDAGGRGGHHQRQPHPARRVPSAAQQLHRLYRFQHVGGQVSTAG